MAAWANRGKTIADLMICEDQLPALQHPCLPRLRQSGRSARIPGTERAI